METLEKNPKSIDEMIAMMQERKKNRKEENEKKYNSPEFQATLRKLRALKTANNGI
jgi:hypothetical protein